MLKMILSAVLVSFLAISGHAQTKGAVYTAHKIEKTENAIRLIGNEVIVVQDIEIRADEVVVILPDHPGR